ncbi:hypothetical protein AB0G05_19585 [Nonomuraea wenchangensis]
MSTSTSANITREEIKEVVGLLGVTPAHAYTSVEISSTTVNGEYENPVSIYRAASQCAEKADEEDSEPGTYPELFNVDSEFGDDDEGTVTKVTPIEEHDPEADRQTAREIVADLTERFHLDRYAKLGLTGDQVAELVRLAMAVCAAGVDEGNQLAWALDFFSDPDAIVKLGETAWRKLGDKYKAIA